MSWIFADGSVIERGWGKPCRKWSGSDTPTRVYQTPACVDCEHFLVGDMPSRMCSKFPDKYIFAPGCSPEKERLENGEVLAETCVAFIVA